MKAEFKDRYERLGLNIGFYRKRKKLMQLQLSELADIDLFPVSYFIEKSFLIKHI